MVGTAQKNPKAIHTYTYVYIYTYVQHLFTFVMILVAMVEVRKTPVVSSFTDIFHIHSYTKDTHGTNEDSPKAIRATDKGLVCFL